MISQPIPTKTKEARPEIVNFDKPEYVLLIDGNSLAETCFHGDKRINVSGNGYGAIFQFLLQIKIMLSKRDFSYVYIFWDGNSSGKRRFEIYPPYKSNRDKSYHKSTGDSEYYKQMDEFVQAILNKKRKVKTDEQIAEKAEFHRQVEIIFKCAEELCIRQCIADVVEGDDFIGYFVSNKKPNQKIVIISSDMDISQLIEPNCVALYSPKKKIFLSSENFKKEIGYDYRNVRLIKQMCGDASDCIKGISGLGEPTLLKIMPDIKDRHVEVMEVVDRAKLLNEDRVLSKKKPLKVYDNIINQVSNCVHNGNVFEINDKIINLKHPLLISSDIEEISSLMEMPLDTDDRKIENLYKLIIEHGVEELLDENRFSNFFAPFNAIREKEAIRFKEWKKKN